MNKDQKLWRDIADEIGDIALPDPNEFEDPSFQRLAKGVVEALDVLHRNANFYSEFATGELWLAESVRGEFGTDVSKRIDEKRNPNTCPTCRHARHYKGACYNMASDNDCDCRDGDERPENPESSDSGSSVDSQPGETATVVVSGYRDGVDAIEEFEREDYARKPHKNPVTGWHHTESGSSVGPDDPDEFLESNAGCPSCPHTAHFANDCMPGDGDQECPCPDGPVMPDDLGDFGGTDYPDGEPPNLESYVADCYHCGKTFDCGFSPAGPKPWCGSCSQPAINEIRDQLQATEDYAREHGLVAGKDYMPEHGIPGRDFDPKKEPSKLPPDHPDYTPF